MHGKQAEDKFITRRWLIFLIANQFSLLYLSYFIKLPFAFRIIHIIFANLIKNVENGRR
jgi:hypothetical protein